MKFRSLSLIFACSSVFAQVQFVRSPDRVAIEIGGRPFSTFFLGADAGKPYLFPLRAPSGTQVTRHFPMETVAGESHDHPHQRGVFFAHENVNGIDFWNNELTYKKPGLGRILLDKVVTVRNGKTSGKLRALFHWKNPDGKLLLVEDRTMVFYDDPANRIVDFDITLSAPGERVVFGDAKDGAFGIRLADVLREDKGSGHIVNADGEHGEAAAWGHRSNWVDYSGAIGGEKLGVAIFDNPGNFRHSERWHVRGYGLFAVNPFGNQVFDKNAPKQETVIEKGKSLRYRWRVVIHPGDAESARIADLYQRYVNGR
jgi:hypothetical protein